MIKQKVKHLKLKGDSLEEEVNNFVGAHTDHRSLYIEGIKAVSSGLDSLFEYFEKREVYVFSRFPAVKLLQAFEEFEDLFFDGLEEIAKPLEKGSVEQTQLLDSGGFIDAIHCGEFEAVFTVDYQSGVDSESDKAGLNTSLQSIDRGFKQLLMAQGYYETY
ncbi:hypothetical protein [Shewanella colwelliana]|uniref:hypothetical protein n=1 Tax=Shewanella colwelliana TaxID=23 RepID=UPI00048C652C|nr:hypothetical protein [Shewanella colwelliana]